MGQCEQWRPIKRTIIICDRRSNDHREFWSWRDIDLGVAFRMRPLVGRAHELMERRSIAETQDIECHGGASVSQGGPSVPESNQLQCRQLDC